MTGAQQHLTGRIRVALPPDEAFRLFTPRGEEAWAAGWQPHFPVPVTDDSAPGTVFQTEAHSQHTTWVVTRREPGRLISYAQLIPGHRAGTVTVVLRAAGQHSEVEATYQLTALCAAAGAQLREFADGYPAYLRSWQDAIAACL